MNNEYDRSGGSWYAPLEREETRPAAKESAAEERRARVGWRILLGVALVLGLIIGTSLFFAGRGMVPSVSIPRRGDSGFSFIMPELPDSFSNFFDGNPGISSDKDADEVMPDDWKDYFSSYYTTNENDKEPSRIPTVEKRPAWEMKLEPAGKKELSLQEVYRDCVESIVSISSYVDGESGYYWGSGIIMSEDGLILTNAHLVEGCDSAKVTLQDDTEYEAKLVGEDSKTDIAVLKIEAKGLTPAVFGDSDALSIGDRVAAIGNPLGEEFRSTLTDGIVSGIDRGIDYDGSYINLIQTNTAINEGSSGGALFNMYGQVVGVTNMKMMSYYSNIEGIGFAIPSSTVRTVVAALIKEGEVRGRPAIGITVGAIPENAAEHYSLPDGLYIATVNEGTDAEKKGIREGDIITAVNGKTGVTSDDILAIRDSLQVGDVITFTIWRDGESSDIDVVIGDMNDVY